VLVDPLLVDPLREHLAVGVSRFVFVLVEVLTHPFDGCAAGES